MIACRHGWIYIMRFISIGCPTTVPIASMEKNMRKAVALAVIGIVGMIVFGCTKTVTNTITGSNSTTSSGEMTWTIRTAGVPGNWLGNGSHCVAWGNNEFIIVGGDSTLTSVDGKSWVAHASNLPSSLGIAWGKNTFVAITWDSTIYSSSDGIAWTKRLFSASSGVYAIAWGNNQFVAVGYGAADSAANAFVSSDGITWTTNPMGKGFPTAIAWGNGRYAAVGYNDISFTSSDGKNWSPDSANIFPGYNNLFFGAGLFLTCSDDMVYTSLDGINWNGTLLSLSDAFPQIVWDGKQFVLMSAGQVLTSIDGVNWTVQTPFSGGEIISLAAGNGIIVGLTSTNIFTSP
jgi:hypothetical protein